MTQVQEQYYSRLHNWWHSIKVFDEFQINNLFKIWANYYVNLSVAYLKWENNIDSTRFMY